MVSTTSRALPNQICDAHHHLWVQRDTDYVAADLKADTSLVPSISSTVHVECGSGYRTSGPEHLKVVGETDWLITNADPITKAFVGAADLRLGPLVNEVLEAHVEAADGKFRGIRQRAVSDPSPLIRPAEHDSGPGLLVDPLFRDGFRVLNDMGLSFDAWVYFPQLLEVVDLAQAFPDSNIILNHLGAPIAFGPYKDRAEVLVRWRKLMAEVATCPNVKLKLGGIGMGMFGMDWHRGDNRASAHDLAEVWGEPIRWCIEQFGVDRCLFESNFPVDRMSTSYEALWESFGIMTDDMSGQERDALFHDTAVKTYDVKV